MKRWNRFEDWLAIHLSLVLSSMKLFFLLNIMIWTAILIQRPQNLEAWLLAIISVWFQGVTLVIINRTSQIQGDRMEAILTDTHEKVMQRFEEDKKRHEENAAQLAELQLLHREKQESDLRRDAMLQRILEAVGGDE